MEFLKEIAFPRDNLAPFIGASYVKPEQTDAEIKADEIVNGLPKKRFTTIKKADVEKEKQEQEAKQKEKEEELNKKLNDVNNSETLKKVGEEGYWNTNINGVDMMDKPVQLVAHRKDMDGNVHYAIKETVHGLTFYFSDHAMQRLNNWNIPGDASNRTKDRNRGVTGADIKFMKLAISKSYFDEDGAPAEGKRSEHILFLSKSRGFGFYAVTKNTNEIHIKSFVGIGFGHDNLDKRKVMVEKLSRFNFSNIWLVE